MRINPIRLNWIHLHPLCKHRPRVINWSQSYNKIQMKLFCKLGYVIFLGGILSLFIYVNIHADIPSEEEFQQLERQIEQQEFELKKAKERAAEDARRKIEEQKLREERAKLEKERLRLEQERKKAESVRQAELEQKKQAEEARKKAIEEQKQQEEKAKKAIVTLVFYRNQSYPFGGDSAIISHNGKEIGRLSSKAYFIYQSPPGQQKFKAVIFGDWVAENTFNFKPASTNFMMTAIDWSTVNITMETVGLEAIKGLQNSGQFDPKQFFNKFDEVMNESDGSKKSDKNFGFK